MRYLHEFATRLRKRVLWLFFQMNTEPADLQSAGWAFIWSFVFALPGDYLATSPRMALFSIWGGERFWMFLFLALCIAHITTVLLTTEKNENNAVWGWARMGVCAVAFGIWLACSAMFAFGRAPLGCGVCLLSAFSPFWSMGRQWVEIERPAARAAVRREARRGELSEHSA